MAKEDGKGGCHPPYEIRHLYEGLGTRGDQMIASPLRLPRLHS
jgi:hypothetical protein